MKTSSWTLVVTLGVALQGFLLPGFVLSACGGKASNGDDLGNSVEQDDGAAEQDAAGTGESERDAGAEQDATRPNEVSDEAATEDDSGEDSPTDVVPAPDLPPMMAPGTGVPTPPITMPPSMTVDPPAEGCVDTSRSVATDYCSTERLCADNSYRYASCSDEGSGEWYCSCSNGQALGTYALTGVDGDTACGAVLDVCDTAPQQPEFTEAPTCEAELETVDTAYCEIFETCIQRAELSEGVAALRGGSSYVYCADVGNGRLSCNCHGEDFNARTYEVTGLTPATACEFEMTPCYGDPQLVFSEEVCEPVAQSEEANSCHLDQYCQRRAALADGVDVQVNEYQNSSCSRDSTGQWRCSCTGTSRSLAFLIDPTATGLGICTDAQAVCNTPEEIVPEGEITCAPNSRSSSIEYCESVLECTQSATADGTTIGLLGNMGANCSEISAGVWSCSCYASTNSQPFELRGAEAEAVCAEAVSTCPDRVELVFGTGGASIDSPVPSGPMPLK